MRETVSQSYEEEERSDNNGKESKKDKKKQKDIDKVVRPQSKV